MAITSKEINAAFSSEVINIPGGEELNACFSCGACSGACPVSQAIPEFDPRKIIHMVRMGLKDKVLAADLLWYCSQCQGCVYVCPQNVRFASIMGALQKLARREGIISEEDLREKGKVAWVERDQCVSCLTCVRVCPFEVPVIDAKGVAHISADECRGCGICVAECPAQAIKQNNSADEKLIAVAGA
ncbi:MAG: 4Fe-4S dicluster domain-containing protein [Thermodesulfobacteriota bacterium]